MHASQCHGGCDHTCISIYNMYKVQVNSAENHYIVCHLQCFTFLDLYTYIFCMIKKKHQLHYERGNKRDFINKKHTVINIIVLCILIKVTVFYSHFYKKKKKKKNLVRMVES